MNQRIKIACGACDKRLAVPTAAAGKKIRCPGCGEGIRVPQAGEGGRKKKRKRPSKEERFPDGTADDEFGEDPYAASGPTSLPPRARKKKSGGGKKSAANNGDDSPGAKKIQLGASIFFGSMVVSAGRMIMSGNKAPVTAEEKGAAFGAALVVFFGVITGLTMMLLGFLANRKAKRG